MSNTTEPSPIEKWADNEVAAMTPVPAPKGTDEELIAAKVRAGLTRAQAIEVIATQAAHDKALAKAEKPATKK